VEDRGEKDLVKEGEIETPTPTQRRLEGQGFKSSYMAANRKRREIRDRAASYSITTCHWYTRENGKKKTKEDLFSPAPFLGPC